MFKARDVNSVLQYAMTRIIMARKSVRSSRNVKWRYDMLYEIIYLLNAIGLTPNSSSTLHIYTQTVHRTTQLTQTIHRTTQLTKLEECGPCPVFASCTLAFALQLRKKLGKTSVRVDEECHLAQRKQNIHNRTYITIRIKPEMFRPLG